ncbi:MAG: tetratricopeptide repeat protein [Leptolyngbyaceae cyanobacterium]
MAWASLNAGEYAEALQMYCRLPEADRSLDDWVNQAVCLIHLNQPEAAVPICDRVLARDSHHAQAWLFKGVALHRLDRYDEAYFCYSQATLITDEHSENSMLAAWQRHLGSFKQWIKQFKPSSIPDL